MVVHGEAPVARALVRVGHARTGTCATGVDPAAPIAPDTAAVVVASHGRDEELVLPAALRAGVPYVGAGGEPAPRGRRCSTTWRRRVPRTARRGSTTPAGLDIGARTAAEIALSVFAEIVAQQPAGGAAGEQSRRTCLPPGEPEVAIDPVCGMAVAVTPASISAQHDGETAYFCGTGCRQAFARRPRRFAR